MKSRSIDAFYMCSAFAAALILAVGSLIFIGVGVRGVDAALAATARLHFLLFWIAYSGGPLVYLFGPTFQPLKRYAREFGLAFASALLVHLGLVALLCLIGASPARFTFIFFGVAAAFAYLLALFSIPGLHQLLPRPIWWLLSNVGLHYIAYAYLVDFLREPLGGGIQHVIAYLPFVVLAVAGPALRVLAYAKQVTEMLLRSARGRGWLSDQKPHNALTAAARALASAAHPRGTRRRSAQGHPE